MYSWHLHHNTNYAFSVFLFKTQILLSHTWIQTTPGNMKELTECSDSNGDPQIGSVGIFFLQDEVACAQSRPTLCNPMNCSPLGSSVHGISQARIPEWAAISSSRVSSKKIQGIFPTRDRTCVSWTGGQILSHWATREAQDGVTDLIFEYIWLHSHSSLDINQSFQSRAWLSF